MCGRFTLRTNWARIARFFQVESWDEMPPRYNIAPESNVTCVRLSHDNASREVAQLHWGLIPSWASDPTVGRKLINARAESIADKPSFRSAFSKRRCLVLADGFFEWKREGRQKRPYYIRLSDDQPFAFAGLWEYWAKNGLELQSCTIVTTAANALLRPLHDRMPVILRSGDLDDWLQPDRERGASLLRPYPDEEMTLFPVSDIVNRANQDVPQCIEPVSRTIQPTLFD